MQTIVRLFRIGSDQSERVGELIRVVATTALFGGAVNHLVHSATASSFQFQYIILVQRCGLPHIRLNIYVYLTVHCKSSTMSTHTY